VRAGVRYQFVEHSVSPYVALYLGAADVRGTTVTHGGVATGLLLPFSRSMAFDVGVEPFAIEGSRTLPLAWTVGLRWALPSGSMQ
jgi:hypothetical protein